MFAYESTSPEELSMSDESALHVYSIEDDWLLVRLDSDPSSKLGFVPRNYCEPLDASDQVQVADAADTEAELEAQRQAEREKELAEKQRQLKLKDKVETWSVSELEGKKKKKGTLGVGNAAVFFASDTDKVSGLQGYWFLFILIASFAGRSCQTIPNHRRPLRQPTFLQEPLSIPLHPRRTSSIPLRQL